jgi:hypothetical protein
MNKRRIWVLGKFPYSLEPWRGSSCQELALNYLSLLNLASHILLDWGVTSMAQGTSYWGVVDGKNQLVYFSLTRLQWAVCKSKDAGSWLAAWRGLGSLFLWEALKSNSLSSLNVLNSELWLHKCLQSPVLGVSSPALDLTWGPAVLMRGTYVPACISTCLRCESCWLHARPSNRLAIDLWMAILKQPSGSVGGCMLGAWWVWNSGFDCQGVSGKLQRSPTLPCTPEVPSPAVGTRNWEIRSGISFLIGWQGWNRKFCGLCIQGLQTPLPSRSQGVFGDQKVTFQAGAAPNEMPSRGKTAPDEWATFKRKESLRCATDLQKYWA